MSTGVDPSTANLTESSYLCSNAGGGGERVLWTAIAHIQRTEQDIVCVVYTGDVDATKEQIISKVKVNVYFSCPVGASRLRFASLGSTSNSPQNRCTLYS